MPASEASIVNRKALACGVIISFWIILSVNAQEIDLEKVLDRAYLATVDYRETFKNLAAEELKTYDLLRKDGSLDDSRQIRSIFVVYQSEYTVEGSNATMEFRNVIEFNGKAVARDDDDTVKFFEKLSKSSSRSEEYRRLKSDGNRFDGKTHVNGFTLGQGIPLQPSVRSFFEFQIIGSDKIDGHDVVVIEYRQTKPTLRIKANATDAERKQEPNGYSFVTFLPDSFRPTNPRIVGKLWIDAKTGQIWRDEYYDSACCVEQPYSGISFSIAVSVERFWHLGSAKARGYALPNFRQDRKGSKNNQSSSKSIRIHKIYASENGC